MTVDIFFLLGYILFLLILWAFPKIRNFIKGHTSELFVISSGYVFLLADINNSNKNIVCFDKSWQELNTLLIVVGLVLAFIGVFVTYREKLHQQSLSDINAELFSTKNLLKDIRKEFKDLCDDNMKDIFKDFFTTTNGNGRVSLYKHEGKHFRLLGRFSNNPIYNKDGQETYSDSEGFIAKGWQNEHYHIHNIPSWSGKSGTAYKNFVKLNCTITDERLKSLTMKSRSFYIYRVNNHNTARNPHGIVVFEKMSDTQIDTNIINNIFGQNEQQIILLMKNMKSLHK